jgi:hypothetical protein
MRDFVLRRPDNLLKQINAIWPVQPRLQKYTSSRLTQINLTNSSIPARKGRIAIVTDVGQGCGGRGSVGRAAESQGGSKNL